MSSSGRERDENHRALRFKALYSVVGFGLAVAANDSASLVQNSFRQCNSRVERADYMGEYG